MTLTCSPQEGSENEEEEREEEDEENTDYLTDSNKENETDEENNVRLCPHEELQIRESKQLDLSASA